MKIIKCLQCKKKPGRKTKSGKYFCSKVCISKWSSPKRVKSKNFAKGKGNRLERDLVHLCNDKGINSYRQPLSGALARKEFKNDVLIGDTFSVEVKARQRFSEYGWLEKCDTDTDRNKHYPVLIKKANNKPFIVELYLDDFFNIIEEMFVNKGIEKQIWKEDKEFKKKKRGKI
jgi:hypothetical protein